MISAIQPAHIVGGRPENLDDRIRKPHGPHPLTGVPADPNEDRLIARPPKAAADAVLAVGFNLQVVLPPADGRLDLFLEDARTHALAFLFARDLMHGFGCMLDRLLHTVAPSTPLGMLWEFGRRCTGGPGRPILRFNGHTGKRATVGLNHVLDAQPLGRVLIVDP
jgi:hypothetical protein